jgi:hypothetical protein
MQLEKQPLELQQAKAITIAGHCLPNALLNEEQADLDIMFGTLFIYDHSIKTFESPHGWHLWNVSADEQTIYDNFNQLQKTMDGLGIIQKHPSQWRIKMIDGSNFSHTGGRHQCVVRLGDKFAKQYKKDYDAIYVYNYAFSNNGRNPHTWDDVEAGIKQYQENTQDHFEELEFMQNLGISSEQYFQHMQTGGPIVMILDKK